MQLELTAVFSRDRPAASLSTWELPGANSHGDTLEEAREHLREAVALVIEANRALAAEDTAGSDVIPEPLRLTA